jgi:hypothetical protein
LRRGSPEINPYKGVDAVKFAKKQNRKVFNALTDLKSVGSRVSEIVMITESGTSPKKKNRPKKAVF